jgi:hypothetical protein
LETIASKRACFIKQAKNAIVNPPPQILKQLQASELALLNKPIFSYKEKQAIFKSSSFAKPQAKCLLLFNAE